MRLFLNAMFCFADYWMRTANKYLNGALQRAQIEAEAKAKTLPLHPGTGPSRRAIPRGTGVTLPKESVDLTQIVDGVIDSVELEVPGCPKDHGGSNAAAGGGSGQGQDIVSPMEDELRDDYFEPVEQTPAVEREALVEEVVAGEVVVLVDVPVIVDNPTVPVVLVPPRRLRSGKSDSKRGAGVSKDIVLVKDTGGRKRPNAAVVEESGGRGKGCLVRVLAGGVWLLLAGVM